MGEDLAIKIFSSIISGLVGGAITGVAAFAAIRVELRYLRRDIDAAHAELREMRKHA